MSSYDDALRAWQEMMARMVPGASADQTNLTEAFFAPLRQQAALVQEAFEQQRRLHADATRQALAPVEELVRLVDEAAKPMRQGAEAFGQASAALRQLADVLDGQAGAVERTAQGMRAQLDLVSAASGLPPREPRPRSGAPTDPRLVTTGA